MATKRYKLLLRRSKLLRGRFLPKSASLTGDYSPRQLDRAAAYLVLTHAEIEAYFEDMVSHVVASTETVWKTSRKVTAPLISMVTYFEGERKGPPATFDKKQFKDRNLNELIHKAISQHKARIKANHGIREKNLCDLLFPIGFGHSDLSTTLTASLDSFGSRRGDLAHQSLAGNPIIASLDPLVEAANVEQIVHEIETVDEVFRTLGKLATTSRA